MVRVRGIGVAVMTRTSGTAPLADECGALGDAELVLLVDDDEAEVFEVVDLAEEEGVGADDDLGGPSPETRGDPSSSCADGGAEGDAEAEGLEPCAGSRGNVVRRGSGWGP